MPTPITWTDVLGTAPELSTISSLGQSTILNYVNQFDYSSLDGTTDEEIYYFRVLLAAHFGTVSKRAGSGAAGPVISETAGALRRAYGMIPLSKLSIVGLNATMYGQQALTILSVSACHGPFVL